MKVHKKLQELGKVGVGLVLADIICGIWLYFSKLLPISFFGLTFTSSSIMPWMILDIVVLILLAHYSWNIELPIKSLRHKVFILAVGVIFGIVSLAHIFRIVFGVDIVIGSFYLPVWLSWIGTIVAAYLSYMSFHFALKRK